MHHLDRPQGRIAPDLRGKNNDGASGVRVPECGRSPQAQRPNLALPALEKLVCAARADA